MKVFRKLRRKLLIKQKYKKYALYAIGEILLVMIGILLAFQVSKWNERKRTNATRVTLYKNIARQLKEDTDVINGNKDYNLGYHRQYKNAVVIIERKDTSAIKSLAKITMNLTKYSDFHSDNSLFKTLVNNGEIKLLTNDTIVQNLQRLDEQYVYINQLEQTHFDAIKLYMIPQINRSIKVSTLEVADPKNLYTFQFQNNFSMMLSLMEEKDSIYQNALNQIGSIIKAIEKEIE